MNVNHFKLKRRQVLFGGIAAVASPAIVGPAMAAGEVTWRVQSVWAKGSEAYNSSMVVIADELAKRTDGRFKLELYGAGELAKASEIFNIVRRGVAQMASTSPGYLGDVATVSGFALGMPATLNDYWQQTYFQKYLGVEQMMDAELQVHGVMYRCEKSIPTELVTTKAVNSVDDFRSLKLRSSGSILSFLTDAGAAATYIDGAELFQALSTGVVDGAHWGAAVGAQSMSLYDVCKFHFKPALSMSTDGWVINIEALNALPDDLRSTLLSLIEERYHARTTEYQLRELIALKEVVAKKGVTVTHFPPEVEGLFAEASKKIVAKEAQKSEKAATLAGRLAEFMGQLGIAG